ARIVTSASGGEFGEQAADSAVDVVADGADGLGGLAGGVVEVPVEVALAGEDGAGVTAAHGDDYVGGLDRFGSQGVGKFLGQVQAEFGHDLDDGWVDLLGGGRSGRAHGHPPLGVVGQQC